jgi:hypothetical protein
MVLRSALWNRKTSFIPFCFSSKPQSNRHVRTRRQGVHPQARRLVWACVLTGIGTEESLKSTFIHKGPKFHCFYAVNLCQTASIIEVFWIPLYTGTPHICFLPTTAITCVFVKEKAPKNRWNRRFYTKARHFTAFMLSTCAILFWTMIDMWDRISTVLLCSFSSDTHNIPKTSIVTWCTYTQNLNYNTVYVYGKLEF